MAIKTIGIITYDHPHLKTDQVFHAFTRRGYRLKIYAFPFVPRKSRAVVFSHRPTQSSSAHPRELAEKYAFDYLVCQDDREIDDACDLYHVLVGKIISAECILGKKIINCHPGIIPAVRGLDAFKWAILDEKPLGVTLHYIDPEVDKGEIISIVPTPIYKTDTLETVAHRHYENEIDVVSNFERYLEHPANPYDGIAEGVQRMRMKRKSENEMVEAFEMYVQRFA
jgi:phosphoribosylglycinamide formyltransferase 1